ncbi:hypothetical protein M0R45_019839 [Rubus argutus]|uniref:Uncharacterized protein n=1 Tax=Rubus argutus TaxID=59490 RepID=A0AAW1X8Z6_RUBAR
MEEVCEGKDFSFPKQEEKILSTGPKSKPSRLNWLSPRTCPSTFSTTVRPSPPASLTTAISWPGPLRISSRVSCHTALVAQDTALSNFEANQDYKVYVSDPEVMVAFPIVGDPQGASFVP